MHWDNQCGKITQNVSFSNILENGNEKSKLTKKSVLHEFQICDLFKIFVHCEVARKIERRESLG